MAADLQHACLTSLLCRKATANLHSEQSKAPSHAYWVEWPTQETWTVMLWEPYATRLTAKSQLQWQNRVRDVCRTKYRPSVWRRISMIQRTHWKIFMSLQKKHQQLWFILFFFFHLVLLDNFASFFAIFYQTGAIKQIKSEIFVAYLKRTQKFFCIKIQFLSSMHHFKGILICFRPFRNSKKLFG